MTKKRIKKEKYDIKQLVYGGRFSFDIKDKLNKDKLVFLKNLSSTELKKLSGRVRGWLAKLLPQYKEEDD